MPVDGVMLTDFKGTVPQVRQVGQGHCQYRFVTDEPMVYVFGSVLYQVEILANCKECHAGVGVETADVPVIKLGFSIVIIALSLAYWHSV